LARAVRVYLPPRSNALKGLGAIKMPELFSLG
jgi:hypothetical protein